MFRYYYYFFFLDTVIILEVSHYAPYEMNLIGKWCILARREVIAERLCKF
jgi:hypothetical protein